MNTHAISAWQAMNALSAHILILDAQGTILAVNEAYRNFALQNGLSALETVCEGVNYLAVCDAVTGEEAKEAGAIANAIRAIANGLQENFSLEYACHAPRQQRWFVARISRFFDGDAVRIIIAHENISRQKQTRFALKARVEQQAAVADLGRYALVNTDLDALMTMAVQMVAHTLDVELTNILELLPDGQQLVIRAGLGWAESLKGKVIAHLQDNTQAAFTLKHPESAVVVEDWRAENRFDGSYLKQQGVMSGSSVVIQGNDRPFGVLSVHTTRQRRFTYDDTYFLESIANVLAAAVERKRIEDERLISEAWFSRVMAVTADAVIAIDHSQRIIAFNPSAEAMFDYTNAEVLGEPLEILLPEAFAKNHRHHVERFAHAPDVARSMGDRNKNLFARRKNGEIFPIEASISKLTHGNRTTFTVFIEDITRRKQVEDEIQQRTEELTSLLNVSQILSGWFDVDELLNVVVNCVVDTLRSAEGASLWLYDQSTHHLIVRAWTGYWDSPPVKAVSADDSGIVGKVYRQCLPQHVEYPTASIFFEGAVPHSVIGVPLMVEGLPLGGLFAHTGENGGTFSSGDLRLLQSLGAQASMAIRSTQLFEQVSSGREHLQLLTQKVITVQEDERQRISRELHDEAGQALTVLKMTLEMINHDLPRDERMHSRMADALSLVDTTMDHIRLLARDLRPPSLDTVGLNPTLHGYCREFSRRTNLALDYNGVDLPVLPDLVAVCLYRFLQEALNNVAKHAKASHITVRLALQDGELVLTVQDDGQGFDVQAIMNAYRGGIGLLGIRERLELLNGWLLIDSRPGEGTQLIAHVPLNERE